MFKNEKATKEWEWLDNADVMQLLHISPRTLQTLRTNGTLPFTRLGKKVYYRKSDIDRVLQDGYTMYRLHNPEGYGKER